jgi:hypothetical protein
MKTIQELYSDPALGLSGIKTFSKRIDKPVKEVKDNLLATETYTLNAPTQRPKTYEQVYSYEPNDIWGIDLCDVSRDSEFNDNVKFLIIVVDIFSSYSWLEPIINKSSAVVLQGFKNILARAKTKPSKLWSDLGSEFYNKGFEEFLEKQHIRLYSTSSGIKCANAERKIRSLRNLMGHLVDVKGNHKYLPELQKLCVNLNTTPNRLRGNLSPKEAYDPKNRDFVYNKLYSKTEQQLYKPAKFQVNDSVRITQERNTFAKESTHEKLSSEIFTVCDVLPTLTTTYKIKDDNNEIIKGKFYENELFKVIRPEKYRIEKIVETKGRGKNKKFLVKWVGYDDNYNEWKTASEIEDI